MCPNGNRAKEHLVLEVWGRDASATHYTDASGPGYRPYLTWRWKEGLPLEPPRVSGFVKRERQGRTEYPMVSTSIVERNYLTIRTFQRRFTRLALGFSRKLANLRAAVALRLRLLLRYARGCVLAILEAAGNLSRRPHKFDESGRMP